MRSTGFRRDAGVLLSAALVVATLAVGARGDSTPSYSWRDGNSGYLFTCPAPPGGFSANPNNPQLVTPSTINLRRNWDRSNPGSDQETVSCFYITADRRSGIWVSANIALPVINVNPISDFYVGCGGNKIDYTQPGYTSYFLASPRAYAYVKFADYNHALTPDEVPTFEQLARELLHNVEPAAHGCKIDFTHPTTVPALWSYVLALTISGSNLSGTLSANGAFITTGGPDARNNLKVTHFYSDATFPLTLRVGGVARPLELHFSKPAYNYHAPVATLTIPVRVTDSSMPDCPKGSTGALTYVSTNQNGVISKQTATLALCRSVLGGSMQQVGSGSYMIAGAKGSGG